MGYLALNISYTLIHLYITVSALSKARMIFVFLGTGI